MRQRHIHAMMKDGTPKPLFMLFLPASPALLPPPQRFLRITASGESVAVNRHIRKAVAFRSGADNFLFHVNRTLVMRLHKSRKYANGPSAIRAQKAKHGYIKRFVQCEQPAHELPMPVRHSLGRAKPAPQRAVRLRQTALTQIQISLYIAIPIQYDEYGESRYGQQGDEAAKP